MRHGRKINHLGRTTAHRHAMLSNMSSSLILHKRVTTTVAKAKALRKYIEPLLTKSKEDTTHSRRMVFAALQDKESIKELFGNISSKIATRPGGYTRILKLSDTRLGDNADMCIIELVDFNETLIESKQAAADKAAAGTTRRSRRGGKKAAGDNVATSATEVKGEAVAPAAVVEQSAPADTATETVKDGESREEAKADEAGA
ncbi:50S ribosomal protein L17 [Hymenobacter rubidus]|uniref:50S ribosomal protein L17 n=1 Tax=Hymenobacter rubidus TaxID=1441626 RepID=UPI00191DB451|nr:50S ribosomal protein L17 [Hymenobacter rubidus]